MNELKEPRNRLAGSASAYLQSAAHQPVHWYPWGEEAFAAARSLDRPILLDIGAVWCHWCHVMDGESYENAELAAFLNQHFLCIKVDRDERPDVDTRYQRAVQSFTGQGGWPLTAFLTPAGDVFYGGTYFPPDDRYGRPGFSTVLDRVRQVYHQQRDQVTAQSGAIRHALAESLDESAPGVTGPETLTAGVESMRRVFDTANGGFGQAPKFPHPTAIRFLLGRAIDSGDESAATMATANLTAMALGGIHDQLGGGFHRYSTDARWIVPHFEKMAYDNAELLRAYVEGAAFAGDPLYLETARGIVHWIRDVLAHPGGGYGASQDADVGLDDDGDYFTWTREEAAAVLNEEELALLSARYDIGTAGEMHHNPSKNVLFVAAPLEEAAALAGIDVARAANVFASGRSKLVSARAARKAPYVDTTIYTNWNAMLAGALMQAAPLLDDTWAREHALLTLTRLRREAPAPDALGHVSGGPPLLLDDQVQTARAALDAAALTGDADWVSWAAALMDRAWETFSDPRQPGLLDRPRSMDGEGLLSTPSRSIQDAPTPSPNAIAAVTCARLAEWTGDARWGDRRDLIAGAFGHRAGALGIHAAALLIAVDWQVSPATHLVVTGIAGDAEASRMHRSALVAFMPRALVRRLVPGREDTEPLPPALAAMLAVSPAGEARAFLCTGASCRPPADTNRAWCDTLRGAGARLPPGWDGDADVLPYANGNQ